jgi:hypothetical protein
VGALLDWRGDPRQLLSSRRRVVKVHGLLRTGTNYVSALLGENLFVHVLGPEDGGWKHGPIDEAPGMVFVVVVKSPSAWLESFYKWELIRGRTKSPSLADFAISPVSHPQLARVWNARDPIDAWNKATAGWVAAQQTGNVLLVRYEDVIVDIGRELDRFTARFPTTRRHRRPVDIESRVGPGWKTVGPVDRHHYTGAPPGLDPELMALLDARLDQELVRSLGYAAGG